MTKNNYTTEDQNDLAEKITDTIETKNAYYIFYLNIFRIKQILESARYGIEDRGESRIALIDRISNTIVSKSTNSPEISPLVKKLVEDDDRYLFEIIDNDPNPIHLSKSGLELIKNDLIYSHKMSKDLHFILNNILCMAAWSALEGYIQASLAEVFTRAPHLLSSDKTITVAEIVSERKTLIEYLVAREIDDVGRKNFRDLQKYLKTKFLFQLSNSEYKNMSEIYFVRNALSHSAGFLRADQIAQAPDNLEIDGMEIRVSDEYLNHVMDCIENTAKTLHSNFVKIT